MTQKPGSPSDTLADFEFDAQIIHWRGPAPFVFAPVPESLAAKVRFAANLVTYGWGMVPVEVSVNGVGFTTALFPKNETYLLPLRRDVQRKTGLGVGDTIRARIRISTP